MTRTRCVLAYSGGLDTSVAIHWLGERGYDVVTLTADLGEAKDADAVAERAIHTGATNTCVGFVKNAGLFPSIKCPSHASANAAGINSSPMIQ